MGDSAGYARADGYRPVRVKGRNCFTHNLIWIWHYGDIPDDLKVDHADRNPSNNVLSNLRLATERQQQINKRKRGFRRQRNKWLAQHSRNNRQESIGRYSTALQARLAYERHTSELEPAFASTFFTDAFNRLLAA